MRTRGYAVVPAALDARACAEIIEATEEGYRSMGSPPITGDGINVIPLLVHAPRLAPYFALPAVLDVLEELMGEPPRLVHASVRISDEHTSAIVDWHHHYAPAPAHAETRRFMERILFNIYPVGTTAETGPLLVRERAFNAPFEPPPAVVRADWPGQIEIVCPPGSFVFMDSAGYHTPKRGTAPGRRYCFRSQYQAASNTTLCDEDNDCDPPQLAAYKAENPRFAALVGPPREAR